GSGSRGDSAGFASAVRTGLGNARLRRRFDLTESMLPPSCRAVLIVTLFRKTLATDASLPIRHHLARCRALHLALGICKQVYEHARLPAADAIAGAGASDDSVLTCHHLG
ncbi:MAG TPA: hypothetical protein VFI42_03625, partial [Thermomicrobiaceae bacterium]|nr:hypothetical protein [Thermomicrobiaceae bacterium]